jgi:hypothetical protein
MATNKKPTYPRNEALFIRITDDEGLKVVKEGSVWTYWRGDSTKDPSYGNDKYLIISNKVRSDLTLAMLQNKFELSDKNDFPPYIPKKQRDKEAKEIEDNVQEKAAAERAGSNTNINTKTPPPRASKSINNWAKMHVPASSTTSTPPSSKGKAGTGSSFVKRGREDKERPDMRPDYGSLSEAQFKLLFSIAYQVKTGSSTGIAKEWASMDDNDRKRYVEEFIEFDLIKKNVPAELLPPLDILRKIPIIAADRELMYYFEKKLGAKKPEEQKSTLKNKIVTFANGLSFNTGSLPVSLRAAFGVSKLAVKGTMTAAKTISNLLSADSKKNTDEEFIKQTREQASQKESKLSSLGSFISGVGSGVKEHFTPSEEDKAINKEMFKLIAAGLNNIASILKDRLVKKGPSEDTTHTAASNVEGMDKDANSFNEAHAASSHEESSTTTDQGKGENVFSKMIMRLLSPLNFLGSLLIKLGGAIKPLLSLFGKLGSSLIGVLGKIGSGIGSVAGRALGAVAGIGTSGLLGIVSAGTAGYALGSYLNEKFNLSDKISDVAMSLFHGDDTVSTTLIPNTPQQSTRNNTQHQILNTSKQSTQNKSQQSTWNNTSQQSTQNKARNSNSSSELEAASKQNAVKVNNAETVRNDVVDNKQKQETKQIIDASKNNNTIIQQQSASINRISPRTQTSSLQKFIESRAVFA